MDVFCMGSKRHWFHFISQGVIALFFGIMLYVIHIAYTRHSGSTGLDMATLQKIRYDSQHLQASSK